MKFLLLLLMPCTCFCQPPKHSTRIIAKVNDTSVSMLNKVAAQLFELGYTFESKDESIRAIVTNDKSSSKYAASHKIKAIIKDSSIVFTSVIALDFEPALFNVRATRSYNTVSKKGAKHSPMMEAWNAMDSIAHRFSTNITYSN